MYYPKMKNIVLYEYREIFSRDNYTCQYCGYNGKQFQNWLQLTIDHIIPQRIGGNNESNNLVTCCHKCNSITGYSREMMEIDKSMAREEILKLKKDYVQKSSESYKEFWKAQVAPEL
jgi:hypothetical protein